MEHSSKRVLELVMLEQDGLTPKMISKLLRIPHATARSAVRRLLARDMIEEGPRGFYCALGTHRTRQGLQPGALLFHGIKLELRAPCNAIEAWLSSPQAASPDMHVHTRNNARVISREFRGRSITISAHQGAGLIEIFCESSSSCLDSADMVAFSDWLEATFYPINALSAKVRQLGLNYDIRGLRLDGVSSITLWQLRTFALRVYEKKNGTTRLEGHIVLDAALEDVLEILGSAAAALTGNQPLEQRRKGKNPRTSTSKAIISKQGG